MYGVDHGHQDLRVFNVCQLGSGRGRQGMELQLLRWGHIQVQGGGGREDDGRRGLLG